MSTSSNPCNNVTPPIKKTFKKLKQFVNRVCYIKHIIIKLTSPVQRIFSPSENIFHQEHIKFKTLRKRANIKLNYNVKYFNDVNNVCYKYFLIIIVIPVVIFFLPQTEKRKTVFHVSNRNFLCNIILYQPTHFYCMVKIN